jgi:hypothetical protein
MAALGKHAPRAADWITETMLVPREFRDEPPRHPTGTLYEPFADGNIYGDHPGFVRPISVYTRAALHPFLTSMATGLAMAAGAAAAAWLLGDSVSGQEKLSKRARQSWGRLPR